MATSIVSRFSSGRRYPRGLPDCRPACASCRRLHCLPGADCREVEGEMNEIVRPFMTVAVVLLAMLTIAAGLIWLERRLLALWQDRYGPNRVGPFGLLQVAADMIKIFAKEDWTPPFADKPVFIIAPAVIVVTVLMSFTIIPFAPDILVLDLNVGLLFFLAMSSFGVYRLVLAGCASV